MAQPEKKLIILGCCPARPGDSIIQWQVGQSPSPKYCHVAIGGAGVGV